MEVEELIDLLYGWLGYCDDSIRGEILDCIDRLKGCKGEGLWK